MKGKKSKSEFLAELCETIDSLPNYKTHNKMHNIRKQYLPIKVKKNTEISAFLQVRKEDITQWLKEAGILLNPLRK